MIATCPSCSARYRIDDSKIKGRGARITCPKCSSKFVVQKTPASPPPPVARPTRERSRGLPVTIARKGQIHRAETFEEEDESDEPTMIMAQGTQLAADIRREFLEASAPPPSKDEPPVVEQPDASDPSSEVLEQPSGDDEPLAMPDSATEASATKTDEAANKRTSEDQLVDLRRRSQTNRPKKGNNKERGASVAIALAIALVTFLLVLQYVQQKKLALNGANSRTEPSTVVTPEAPSEDPASLEDPNGALVESEDGATNGEKEEGNLPETEDAPIEPSSQDNEDVDPNIGN